MEPYMLLQAPQSIELSQPNDLPLNSPIYTGVSVNNQTTNNDIHNFYKVSDVNTEALIAEVFARKELWDRRLTKHVNQPFAQVAWQEISEKMGFPVNILRKKWKNLRDHFGVELAKPSESRWAYFEALYFLKGIVKPREKSIMPEPQEDPLAGDPLDIDAPALDPLALGPGDAIPAEAPEEKFDPANFELLTFVPSPPTATTATTSIQCVSELEPKRKKACLNDFELQPNPNAIHTNVSLEMGNVSRTRDFAQNFDVELLDATPTDTTNVSFSVRRDGQVLSNDPNHSPIFSNTKSVCWNDFKGHSRDFNQNANPNDVSNANASKYCDQTPNPNSATHSNPARSYSAVQIPHRIDARNKNMLIKRNGKFLSKNVSQKLNSTDNSLANVSIDLTEEEEEDQTSDSPFEDEDFFRSLMPHVKKIPPHLKLRFRNKVLYLVEEFAYPKGQKSDY